MPFVTVEMLEGRTPEQKKQVAEGITEVLVRIGVPRDAIRVLIKDHPGHNWAQGGKFLSET